MTGELRDAVRHDVQQLVADLGLWLTEQTGGTVAANRVITADFLIAAFDAAGLGETVTDRLMAGLKEHKKGMKE